MPGYCLPKDAGNCWPNYRDMLESLIHTVAEAHVTLKDFISNEVVRLCQASDSSNVSVVGICRLVMMLGSDNFFAFVTQGQGQQH